MKKYMQGHVIQERSDATVKGRNYTVRSDFLHIGITDISRMLNLSIRN